MTIRSSPALATVHLVNTKRGPRLRVRIIVPGRPQPAWRTYPPETTRDRALARAMRSVGVSAAWIRLLLTIHTGRAHTSPRAADPATAESPDGPEPDGRRQGRLRRSSAPHSCPGLGGGFLRGSGGGFKLQGLQDDIVRRPPGDGGASVAHLPVVVRRDPNIFCGLAMRL